MAVYTLFGQPNAPATLTADTSAYTMGMQFSLSQSATLTGIWFYSAPGAAGLPVDVCIYQITGTNTGTQVPGSVAGPVTWSGAAGSGWVKYAYASGPVLSSGVSYRVCVCNAGSGVNWYSGTSNYWSSGPGASGLTSGIISAPNGAGADGGNQDAFIGVTSLTYPTSSFNSGNYWIDVEVTTTGSPPDGIIPLVIPPGLASPAAWSGPPMPAPATGLTDPTWTGPASLQAPVPPGTEYTPPRTAFLSPPMTSPASWSQPWVPRTDSSYPPPPQPVFTAPASAVPGAAQPGFTTPASPDITISQPAVTGTGAQPAATPPFAPPFTTPSSWSQPWVPSTDPSWSGPAKTGPLSRGRAARGSAIPRPGTARGAPGTTAQAVPGAPGTITAIALPGTVQAVTGSPGRVIRRPLPVPHRGSGSRQPGTLAAAISGTPAAITVSAAPGTATAVTGSPGRVIRRPLPVPHRGSGSGQPGTLAAAISGTPGTITVTALPGTVQAVTGSPGRVICRIIRMPAGRGVTSRILAPGQPAGISGPAAAITVAAPPGAAAAAVSGPAAAITASAPAGTVQAVTGSPGRVIRRVIRMPAGRGSGTRAAAVPVYSVIPGPAGVITIAAPPGSVTAVFTRLPQAPHRPSRVPLLPGRGRGNRGTAAISAAGPPAVITVTAPAGIVGAVITAGPAIITVAGGAGWVTNLPPRYVRWRVRHGFTSTAWRSHVTAGNTGMISIRAVPGTVSTQSYTASTARGPRPAAVPRRPPSHRGAKNP